MGSPEFTEPAGAEADEPTEDGAGDVVPAEGRPTIMESGALLAGKYRLVAPLGDGGMGKVWLALHVPLGRSVALKVLRRDRLADPGSRERFRREARAAGALRHPGIVQPLDFGELDDGREFLAMELAEGTALDRLLRVHGRLPWRVAVRIGLDLCEALGFAHAHGIIHRDLKPSNVAVETRGEAQGETQWIAPDGSNIARARILDLGVVRDARTEARQSLTGRGAAVGTPRYAAPEQAIGEEVGPQGDLYAFGALLYRVLTGEPPYSGQSFDEVYVQQQQGPPVALAQRCPDPGRPRELDELVYELLAWDPNERPAGAGAVYARLQALLAQPDASAQRVRRWGWIALGVGAAVGLTGLGAALGAALTTYLAG